MIQAGRRWLPFKRGERQSTKPTTQQRSESTHPLVRMENELHQVMDRMLDRFGFSPSLWPSHFGLPGNDAWFGDFSPEGFLPTLDLADKGERLEVTVELPGVDAEDIQLSIRDGALVLRGEKRLEESVEEDGCYRTERAFGEFERVVPLPAEVDAERVEAKFDKGVLEILLPKSSPSPSSRSIEIRTA